MGDDATAQALSGPIDERGGRIDPDGLTRAVAATSGYAFMVQLVGFHTWKAAVDPIAARQWLRNDAAYTAANFADD